MKKFFFTGLLAIGSFVAVNAQTTNTFQDCCSRESDVNLTMTILPILCLTPTSDQFGFIFYDCRDDFDGVQDFRQALGLGSKDFNFQVWSNIDFKVSTVADGSDGSATWMARIGGTPAGYSNFPLSNIAWKVAAASTVVGTPLVAGVGNNYVTTAKNLSNVDATGDNTIDNGQNGVHNFTLNFWTKTGASLAHHPTQYAPGIYFQEVNIIASAD